MTTELATPPATLTKFTPDQINLIKTTVAKGATDDELKLFIHIAQKSGLDPFSRQIYAIKRWDSKEKKEILQAQTSIDGYRLIAERTGKYVPGPKPVFAYKPDGSLLSATAYIKKFAGAEWHVVEAEAFWDEYAVFYERDGKKSLGAMWAKMPHVMLSKCAESLVIRRAFPNETSGVYTAEEMSNATESSTAKSVRMPEAIEMDPAPDRTDRSPEQDEFPSETVPNGGINKKQQNLLYWTIKKKGWTEEDLVAYSKKMFKKDDPLQMDWAELSRTLDVLKTLPDVKA